MSRFVPLATLACAQTAPMTRYRLSVCWMDALRARKRFDRHASTNASERVYPGMDKTRLLGMLTSLHELPGITLSGTLAHSLDSMKKCRTHELGGRMLECPECGTRIIQYNPCNIRGCPICYLKNQIQWKTKARKRILPTRHYHLTFSIPEHYTRIWLSHKKEVVESLFQAVRVAIQTIVETEGLLIGSLLVFQSHGTGMSYKPHMHCVLSGGGLDGNGRYRELRSIPFHALEAMTEEEFESNIKKSLGAEEVAGICLEKSNSYKVYTGVHKENGNTIIEYLSGTRNGVVVDIEEEIEEEDNGIVIKQNDNGIVRITHLDTKTFLVRYLNHIPPARTVMARYYGLYSNRHKEDYKRARKQVKNENEKEEVLPYNELCPVCNAETRVAFLFKRDELHLIPGIRNKNGPPRHGCIINIA